jgi:capsular exopolysaccharide synthesis family protein
MTLSPNGKGRTGTLGSDGQLHLRDILGILTAHWRLVAFLTAVVVFAAYASSRRAVPRYQSALTVQVNSKKQVFARLDDIDVDELALKTDPVLSEALVLTTQRLALTVVDHLGLRLQFQDHELWRDQVVFDVQVDTLARPDSFVLRLKGPAGYEVRDAGQQLIAAGGYDTPAAGPGFSFKVRPYQGEPYEARFVVLPRAAAAAIVSGGLAYEVRGQTTSIVIRFTGTDPTLVPHVLNAAATALREFGADRTRDMAQQRLNYVRSQVEQAAERYRQSLAEVQRYKERQSLIDLSAEEIAVINSIQEFEREKQRRLVDVAALRNVLTADTAVSVETVNRLAAIPALATNTALAFQIQNLLKLYDERSTLTAGSLGLRESNPQVGALDVRIAQSGRTLRAAAFSTLRSMQDEIVSLDRHVAELRQHLQTYPGKENQFSQLTLETELLNDTYRYLLTQYQAAEISTATIRPYIEIMDAPSPASRIGIGTRQRLTIGLLVGLVLGVLAAFLLEYLDQTIRTASDVERALTLPVLGRIPVGARGGRFGGGGRPGALPLVSLASPEDPVSEAYRTLRTNVTFVNAEARALQLLCVTSPGPGEGKTTTAANLAITLAQQGTRTLLVDADLRRPLVHRALSLVQEPGLTDILVGTAMLREAVRPNVAPGLDVLPAGALPPNPSELLGSAAMHRLLDQLRAEYEAVVFDSPPSLAVTDATVLGASADAVILVLRAGETEERAAQQAVEQMRRVHARVAGVVLNGVEQHGDKYYDYYKSGRRRPGALAELRHRVAKVL